MARTNKTSQVMRLFSDMLPDAPKQKHPESPQNVQQYSSVEFYETERIPPERPSRRRKIIAKSDCYNAETLVAEKPTPKNPAFRDTTPVLLDPLARGDKQRILNVSAILVSEELGAVVHRFNICDCDECLSEIYSRSLAAMPPAFVKIGQKQEQRDVLEKYEELRPIAIQTLTKICISLRANPIH